MFGFITLYVVCPLGFFWFATVISEMGICGWALNNILTLCHAWIMPFDAFAPSYYG